MIRITVNLVQVDAIVTDSKGRQVTNLQPTDFEILEDGRPQTITNFSYIFTAKPAGMEARVAPAPAAAGIPVVAPAGLQPEQVRRSIVILVDDLHIAFENMVYVREAVKKFIDQDVQPGDLVAILHTSSGLGVRQQFTNDKRVLHAAVDRLRYYLIGGWGLPGDSMLGRLQAKGGGDFAHRDKNELEAFRKDLEAAERWEFRQQAANVGTMDALEYVLGGLRDLPGRKAVFLVSEGFPICTAPFCTLEQKLREIADLANRSATVVYSIGAQGLPSLSLDASMSGPPGDPSDPQSYANFLSVTRSAYFQSQGPLAFLAQSTEGLFVHDNNDLAGGMHDMMEDMSGYYLIGYKPSADTFKKDRAGRDFHKIQVKVKVRGLRVRTRPGFYGVPDGQTRPVYRTLEEQLKAAIVLPFGTSGVGIQVAPQFLSRGSKNSVARLRLHIDVRDLTFQDASDGAKKSTADLLAVAYGDNGAVISGVGGVLKGSFQPAEFEALLKRGAKYKLDLPIKEPGGYQVRVAVRDPVSQKIGSASQFIEIPKLRTDGPTLSGIVLNASVLGDSGPAVRQFRASDSVSYEFEIYNAQRASAAEAPKLEGKIQIFREGRLVSAQDAGTIRQVPGDSKLLVMSGEFALATDAAPGDYALLVTITDKLAPPKRSAARQWIDFEVVP